MSDAQAPLVDPSKRPGRPIAGPRWRRRSRPPASRFPPRARRS